MGHEGPCSCDALALVSRLAQSLEQCPVAYSERAEGGQLPREEETVDVERHGLGGHEGHEAVLGDEQLEEV